MGGGFLPLVLPACFYGHVCDAHSDGGVLAMTGSRNTTVPVDVATMRETAAKLLGPDDGPDALPPAPSDVATLTVLLRGQLELIVPEVEAAAGRLGRNSIPRYCAVACVGEARGKLRAVASPAPGGDVAYARRLARVLAALCDHYETLGGLS